MPFHAGSLEALRVTRPEAVGLERTKEVDVMRWLRVLVVPAWSVRRSCTPAGVFGCQIPSMRAVSVPLLWLCLGIRMLIRAITSCLLRGPGLVNILRLALSARLRRWLCR